MQVRTPPERPADGVVGCVYESFVPGVWHRWLEKEILWFCFRRAEPERMISGWTASSRDSSIFCNSFFRRINISVLIVKIFN